MGLIALVTIITKFTAELQNCRLRCIYFNNETLFQKLLPFKESYPPEDKMNAPPQTLTSCFLMYATSDKEKRKTCTYESRNCFGSDSVKLRRIQSIKCLDIQNARYDIPHKCRVDVTSILPNDAIFQKWVCAIDIAFPKRLIPFNTQSRPRLHIPIIVQNSCTFN